MVKPEKAGNYLAREHRSGKWGLYWYDGDCWKGIFLKDAYLEFAIFEIDDYVPHHINVKEFKENNPQWVEEYM